MRKYVFLALLPLIVFLHFISKSMPASVSGNNYEWNFTNSSPWWIYTLQNGSRDACLGPGWSWLSRTSDGSGSLIVDTWTGWEGGCEYDEGEFRQRDLFIPANSLIEGSFYWMCTAEFDNVIISLDVWDNGTWKTVASKVGGVSEPTDWTLVQGTYVPVTDVGEARIYIWVQDFGWLEGHDKLYVDEVSLKVNGVEKLQDTTFRSRPNPENWSLSILTDEGQCYFGHEATYDHTGDGSGCITVKSGNGKLAEARWIQPFLLSPGEGILATGYFMYGGDGELEEETITIQVYEDGNWKDVAGSSVLGTHQISTGVWNRLESPPYTPSEPVSAIAIYLRLRDCGGNEWSEIYFDDLSVTLLPKTNLTITPVTFTLISGDSITLTATLTDENGNPLSGKLISWAASQGTLTPSSGFTDNSGQVSVTYTSPNVAVKTEVSIRALFSGDNEHSASYDNSSGIVIPATKLVLDRPPASVPENFTITFKGRLTIDVSEKGVENVPILIYDACMGTLLCSGTTRENGFFFINWVASTTVEAFAKFEGSPDLGPSQSDRFLINVTPPINVLGLTLDPPPSSVVEGEIITFTGRLMRVDTGVGVRGAEIIILEKGNFLLPENLRLLASGFSDEEGRFSIPWEVKNLDWWDRKLEIFAQYYGVYSQLYEITVKLATVLNLDEPPKSVPENTLICISGKLTTVDGTAIGNVPLLVFFGSENISTFTDDTGVFRVSWVAKTTCEICARFEGSNSLGASESPRYLLTVTPPVELLSLSLDPLPPTVDEGENVTFKGRVTRKDTGSGVRGTEVKILGEDISNTGKLLAVCSTDENGFYSGSWIACPFLSIKVRIYAQYDNLKSNERFVSIRRSTELVLDPPPARLYAGDTVIFTGQLTAKGKGVPNEIITIFDEIGRENLGTGLTDERGRFSIEWVTSEKEEIVELFARFDGSENFAPSESQRYTMKISIEPRILSYYSGFFLEGVPIYNTYQLVLPLDIQPGRVVFQMNENIIEDNDPIDGWKAQFNMGNVGLKPELKVCVYLENREKVWENSVHPLILQTPDWLKLLIKSSNISFSEKTGSRYWRMHLESPEIKPIQTLFNINIPVFRNFSFRIAGIRMTFDISSDMEVGTSIYFEATKDVPLQIGPLQGNFIAVLKGTINLDSSIKWKDGWLIISGEINREFRIPIKEIPFLASCSVVGRVGAFGSLQFELIPSITGSKTLLPGFTAKGEGEVGLKGEGGILLRIARGIASVEGGVGVKGGLRLELPDEMKKFFVEVYLFLRCKVLWRTVEKKYKWSWSSNPHELLLQIHENVEIGRSSYSSYTTLGGSSQGELVLLQSDVYPYPSPSIAVNSKGEMFVVWTAENFEKEASKAFEIFYSWFDPILERWTPPRCLTMNEFIDYDPVVTFLEDGRVLVAWNQVPLEFPPDANIEEALGKSRIVYSIWSPLTQTWTEPLAITSEGYWIGKSISTNGKRLLLLYILDRDNDPFTLELSDLYYSVWEENSWSETKKVVENCLFLSIPCAGLLNSGDGAIVFSRDRDDNLETEDTEVCLVRHVDDEWGHVEVLCDGREPRLVEFENKLYISWIGMDTRKLVDVVYFGELPPRGSSPLFNPVTENAVILSQQLFTDANRLFLICQIGENAIPYVFRYFEGRWRSPTSLAGNSYYYQLSASANHWQAGVVFVRGEVGEVENLPARVKSDLYVATPDICPPPAPSLLSPHKGATLENAFPHFRWEEARDKSGVSYELEIQGIGTDFSFRRTGLLVPSYQLTENLAEGEYQWRVRAIDGQGNVGDWSSSYTFRVVTPKPSLWLMVGIPLMVTGVGAGVGLWSLRKRPILTYLPKFCKKCGTPVATTAKFCRRCGAILHPAVPAKYCRKCGALLTTGVHFCSKCGVKLREN